MKGKADNIICKHTSVHAADHMRVEFDPQVNLVRDS